MVQSSGLRVYCFAFRVKGLWRRVYGFWGQGFLFWDAGCWFWIELKPDNPNPKPWTRSLETLRAPRVVMDSFLETQPEMTNHWFRLGTNALRSNP